MIDVVGEQLRDFGIMVWILVNVIIIIIIIISVIEKIIINQKTYRNNSSLSKYKSAKESPSTKNTIFQILFSQIETKSINIYLYTIKKIIKIIKNLN